MKLFAGLIAALLGLGWFSIQPMPQPTNNLQCYSFGECPEERWKIDVNGIDSILPSDTSRITFIVKGLCVTPNTQIRLYWPNNIVPCTGDTFKTQNFNLNDSIILPYDIYFPDSGRFHFYLLVKTDSIKLDTSRYTWKDIYVIIEGDSVLADTIVSDSSKVCNYYPDADESIELDTVQFETSGGDATIQGYVCFKDLEQRIYPSPGTRMYIKGGGERREVWTDKDGKYSKSVPSGEIYTIMVRRENETTRTEKWTKKNLAEMETDELSSGTHTMDTLWCNPASHAAMLEKCYYAQRVMTDSFGYTPDGKVEIYIYTSILCPTIPHYHIALNFIHLQKADFGWTEAHEYGHWIDDKMYGSTTMLGGDNNLGHDPVTNHTTALCEGWAEFLEAASEYIYPDYNGIDVFLEYHYPKVENFYSNNGRAAWTGEGNHTHGDSCELVVTQFFWDLWDDDDIGDYNNTGYDDESHHSKGTNMKTVFVEDKPHSLCDFKEDWDDRGFENIDKIFNVVVHPFDYDDYYDLSSNKPTAFKPSFNFSNNNLNLSWTPHSDKHGRFEILKSNGLNEPLENPDYSTGPTTTSLNITDPYEGSGHIKWRVHAIVADTSPADTFLYAFKSYDLGFENTSPLPYANSPWADNPVNVTNVVAERSTAQKYQADYSYKFSGNDNSTSGSYAYYNLFNIWSPLFNPSLSEETNDTKHNYLSAYFKVVQSPTDSLHVSFDGILDPWDRLEQVWDDDYGWVVDQYGQRIKADIHKLSPNGWNRYVFNLAPAHTNMLKNISLAYNDDDPSETGNFEVYVDNLVYLYNYPVKNKWYVEVFGGDKNANVTWQEDKNNDQVDFILEGNGLADGEEEGWVGSTIYHHPCIRKDLYPFMIVDGDNSFSWSQYDKAHSLIFSVLVAPPSLLCDDQGSGTNGKWLSYAANASNHWGYAGFVDMGETVATYDEWEDFTRNLVDDYNTEYDPDVTSLEIKAYRIGHFAMKEWTGDHGGSVKVIVIDQENPGGSNSSLVKVIRPPKTESGPNYFGPVVPTGENYVVEWQDLGVTGADYYILRYSINGTSGPWSFVAPTPVKSPAGKGRYTNIWAVPDNISSTNCYLRVYAYDDKGTANNYSDDVVLCYGESGKFWIMEMACSDDLDPRDYQLSAPPMVPSSSSSISWEVLCSEGEGPDGIDIDYSLDGGGSFSRVASDIDPSRDGTYGLLYSETVGEQTVSYYGYSGSYSNWTVPNIPTTGLMFRYWVHQDSDSFYCYSQRDYSIANGTGSIYSTAFTGGKQGEGSQMTNMVYTDNSDGVKYCQSDDGIEWDTTISISGAGRTPSSTTVNDTPVVVWKNTSDTDQVMYIAKGPAWVQSTLIYAYGGGRAQILSEPNTFSMEDSIQIGVFSATGYNINTLTSLALIGKRIVVGGAGIMDTVYQHSGTVSAVTKAPALAVDHDHNTYYAFVYNGHTVFIYDDGGNLDVDTLTSSSVAWPSFDVTTGNVYLTYAAVVSGDTVLLRKWRYTGDSIWRGTDTLYKGPLDHISTAAGVYTLITDDAQNLKLLTYNPLYNHVDTSTLGDSIYNPHVMLSRLSSAKEIALEWTERVGTSYYVMSERKSSDALLPVIYLDAGSDISPYTTYRDSTYDYEEPDVDIGLDSLVYTLDDLDTSLDYNLALEFYFEDDSITSREFIVTVAGETDTVTVSDSTLTRYTIVIDSPDSSLAVKITGDEIGLDRLVLYEADGTIGGYFSKDSDEEPDEVKKLPIAFSLESVIPTPFTDNARVCFAMPVAQPVSLKVYDVAGREVCTLVNGLVDAGVHTLYWNGEDNQSRSVSSGVYFVRMATAGFEATRKTVLLR